MYQRLDTSAADSIHLLGERSVVLWADEGWSFGSDICLCHSTVHDEVLVLSVFSFDRTVNTYTYLAVDKARLVTRQKQYRIRLLNSFTESSTGEMDLASLSLGDIISQPILQKRSVQRSWAKRVESQTLSSMHNSQFSRKSQNSTLGSSVRQLRSSGTDQGDDRRSVDDGALSLLVLAHGEHGVLAAEPDTLDVDGLSQVPDLLGCVDGVSVVGVHYTGVVEHDIYAAPGVYVCYEGFNVGLLGDIADLRRGLVM